MPPRATNLPPHKTCPHCRQQYSRGPGQRANRYRKQTYCSRACSRAARAIRDRAKLPNSRDCEHCGRTFHRPRYAHGRLQSSGEWAKRKYCGHECQTKAATKYETTKTCQACGTEFQRKRHNNGRIESSTQWRKRTACSVDCANALRRQPKPERTRKPPKQHPPCARCDANVERRAGETASMWHKRKYCSTACANAAVAEHRAKLARDRRIARLAPARYVFDGRFPTPATLRSSWVTVTGPDTGRAPSFRNNTVNKRPETHAALRAAVLAHPDLATALAGLLSDSWVQQDAATYTGK